MQLSDERCTGAYLYRIASTLHITERSAFSIVDDLILAGYVAKEKEGRRNRYHIQVDGSLGEGLGREQRVGELLKFLVGLRSARRQLKADLNGPTTETIESWASWCPHVMPFSHGQ